jgi:hypothetical protein
MGQLSRLLAERPLDVLVQVALLGDPLSGPFRAAFHDRERNRLEAHIQNPPKPTAKLKSKEVGETNLLGMRNVNVTTPFAK